MAQVYQHDDVTVARGYEQVLGVIAQPAILMDCDGQIVFANETFSNLVTVDDSCLLGLSLIDALDVDTARILTEFIGSHKKISSNLAPLETELKVVAFGASLDCDVHVIWDYATNEQLFLCIAETSDDVDKARFQELQNSEMRLRIALDSSGHAVWDTDRNAAHYVSDNWYRIRGIDPDQDLSDAVDGWIDEVHPDDRPVIEAAFERQNKGRVNAVNYQYRQRHKDGHWVWILSKGFVVSRDQDGQPHRLIGIDIDISELKRIEQDANDVSERLKVTMAASDLGLWDFNPRTREVNWNDNMFAIFGVARTDNADLFAIWEDKVHPDDKERVIAELNKCIAKEGSFRLDYRIIRDDSSIGYLRTSAKYVRDKITGAGQMMGVDIDLTSDVLRTREIEETHALMEYENRHDALTGLGNRRLLDEAFDNFIKQPDFISHSVLHIDVDHFKQINDNFGHLAGDLVLKHIGDIVTDVIGTQGVVARVGGDEIVAFLPFDIPHADLERLASDIVKWVSEPFRIGDTDCKLGVSIGIATSAEPQTNYSRIFADADMALYEAKRTGRNRVCTFSIAMRTAVKAEESLLKDLTDAIENGEIGCHYQPQYDAKTRALVGVEALVRWASPTRGMVMPISFLAAADKAGLTAKVDRLVLQAALADLEKWAAHGVEVPHMSVNVSTNTLSNPDLPAELAALVIPRNALTFELLETTFLDGNEEDLIKNINAFRDLGIDIAIDDFGSGHASVISFLRIAPSTLKIDRELVLPVLESDEQKQILASIIEIARLKNACIVAEGVETLAHADVLTEMGCDILQGYGLSRPIPPDAVLPLLQAQRRSA